MSSRHPEPGAGAEYADPRDSSCDYCGRTIYTGLLHQITLGGSLSWQCSECFARTQQRYAEQTGEAA